MFSLFHTGKKEGTPYVKAPSTTVHISGAKAPRGEYEEQHAGQNRWIMGLRPRTLKCRSPIRCSTITALTGFGRLIFELIYNKPSTSRQHNSTGTIFASQKVQTAKRAASNMTLNQRGHVQKSSET